MLRSPMLAAAALTVATAALTTAQADVYKSMDTNGQPRFSDVWTPGSTLVKGLTLKNGQLTASQGTTPPPQGDDDSARKTAAKAAQADRSAFLGDQCAQLKDQYDKEIRARRILKPGSTSDNPLYMTDEEADAERTKTRQEMDEACGAGG